MAWFYLFFVLSGACSLIYQVTWLRSAMAAFGVTTASVSIVLSVFMAGLALGSWGAGRLLQRFPAESGKTFIRLYAAAELLIGISGLVVAPLLLLGQQLLTTGGSSWDSSTYYLISAGWISLTMLPFCTAMGATFPLAMAAIRALSPSESPRSFSYLYVANVLGAVGGVVLSAFVLIELLGFRNTMLVAAGLNVVVAALALMRSFRLRPKSAAAPGAPAPVAEAPHPPRANEPIYMALLFFTGLVAVAMEVVWTRQFIPFQGPVVYTFATMLAIYLAATFVGSRIYRAWAQRNPSPQSKGGWRLLTLGAAAASLLPLVTADSRFPLTAGAIPGALRVALGIIPFCLLLGILTPMILDRQSGGDPRKAGFAYALNTLGCIVGPLLAGFLLLPTIGERNTLIVLAAPLFLLALLPERRNATERGLGWGTVSFLVGSAAVAFVLVFTTKDFETQHAGALIRRDHTATVIASGEGMGKRLFVNGVSITHLTPITKMMTHLPLAHLPRAPKNGLVLCLGMGTSFRSMLSWDIRSTVVELVPSVPSLLGFYHADGQALLASPNAVVVVDDARRFLERTSETFDVIVIDPPPPVEAAASSLLYSKEFYELAAKRLAPDGILQQWLPGGDAYLISSMTKALAAVFPHIRIFGSQEGWGLHFLAGTSPILKRSAAEAAAQLPKGAVRDLLEWGPEREAERQFARVLPNEKRLADVVGQLPNVPVLSDDRPVNEYYLLRTSFLK